MTSHYSTTSLLSLIFSTASIVALAQTAPPAELAGLQGVWARSEADCKLDLTAMWDRGDIDRVIATSYAKIGFCPTGFALLYEAHRCRADAITAQGNTLAFKSSCSTKGQPSSPRFTITREGPDRLSFDEADFTDDLFTLKGSYVRCSRAYTCEEQLDLIP